MGRIITVDGEIAPDSLGVTLPHEHLFVDGSGWIDDDRSRSVLQDRFLHEDVSMETLSRLRDNPYTYDNCRLDDVETIASEVQRFHDRGGDSIVDVTSVGLHRDPSGLRTVSRRTGVNVIAGCGYYISDTHPSTMDEKSKSDIAAEIVSDIENGIGDTGVRAGIIGELGATKGFVSNDNEKKAFRGAAIAQQRTGVPITIHPPYNYEEAHDILDVLEDEGANLENVVMGHLSDTIRNEGSLDYHTSIGDRGVFLAFDDFGMIGHRGTENDYYQEVENVGPLDEDRINRVVELYEAGYDDQLLLSHDVWRKTQLATYGGRGYAHLLDNIVPRLQQSSPKRNALDREAIEVLTVQNVREMLTVD
ncbi:aryldialkylphosphatase [Halobellus salinus]|uniref:Aryldialkylphosphatase n=1 Tax=Halobellus salinus TaxID=931585 RepID=A0A830EJR0_9EURY|nr:phosphotriesterase-related protein [Halobellus salinus]GGJ16967.1 aryldialkylphosphatase [Halobellus salinus]SMP34385.1 phosphotriesterase-related protein [Halobellus salinus]